MQSPRLIIITGMPGSGKTTLAESLSAALSLPLIEKDSIKELLFDSLGWSDREWSKKLGKATYGLMDYFIEQQLRNGNSVIVESNFKPEFDSVKFKQWKDEFECDITQLLCHAPKTILYDRFKTRAINGERHPGHADTDSLEEWKDYFANPKNVPEPLDVDSKIKWIDTTDFSSINNDDILHFILQ
jgi:predicted kinase